MHVSRITAIVALLLFAVGVTGVSAQTVQQVDVVDNAFQPGSVEVTGGDTVRWTQSGSNPHTVTADDGSFDSHPNCPPDCMGEGDSFEVTFDEPGEVAYYCKLHGGPGGQGMSGVVVVQAAQQPTDDGGDEAETGSGGDGAEGDGQADVGSEEAPEEARTELGTEDEDEEAAADELPRTGADPLAIGLLALALAGLGTIALAAGRRLRE